ncbi:MAG: hypothetical protein FWB74_06295, partial [Defluviitaleaceae bacterium]|nr:hypothetical protein [Defluviitaleaceae bacterium]
MFKEKILPLGVAAALVGVIIFLATRGGGHDGLRIASSNDAAGTAVALAAGQDRHTTAVALADCCGAQAEIALEAGVFDMAVICPDAALVFLQ